MTRWLPPEWAEQSAVALTWPHPQSDWAPQLAAVDRVYTDIARAVTARQQLLIACFDQHHTQQVTALLRTADVDLGRVSLYEVPSNDSWTRDHGPITILDGGVPRLLDFQFNGWGRKHPHKLDNLISGELHRQGAFGATPIETVELVLEGGSIESDGEGTLLTTSHCLLSPERNPQLDCIGLEAHFERQFGIQRVLWLDHGELEGDDTDSHIDTLARFCNPTTIAYVKCDNPDDSHYASLQAMEAELQAFETHDGTPYTLVPLPLPSPIHNDEGDRLPATYANFLIINGAVLLPIYGVDEDAVAIERITATFPEREVVAINCRPLVHQFGSLHCVTMQLPAGVV